MESRQQQEYQGFEQGPIRPPSEARSLLIRVTRNCPWNKCTFCSVYKGEKFSLRPVDHVTRDIDSIHAAITRVRDRLDKYSELSRTELNLEAELLFGDDRQVFYTALDWLVNGDGAVFLQDANSLIMKPDQLCTILEHLRHRFPWVTRITSYARSHTINRIGAGALEQLAAAGLNRIHIGMESGSDLVLAGINKGVTRQGHIDAGQAVKAAGIELSEYIMPGLGGRDLSEVHAMETASALNRIDPDFIRLRSLAIQPGSPLYTQYHAGRFNKNTELQTIIEIRALIEHLEGITSTLKSDHLYNLLQEIEGGFPRDKEKMLQALDFFLGLSKDEQVLFQFGRRTGYFHALDDLSSPARRSYVHQLSDKFSITPENIEHVLERQTSNYI
jgi:radical SAM superfamily enzyme YgiQ (UPF0313 family)